MAPRRSESPRGRLSPRRRTSATSVVRYGSVRPGPPARRLTLERAERDVPRGAARREQAVLGRDVDEALDANAEPLGKELGEGDLVAAREDDLAAAHDACLQRRRAEVESDDERAERRGGGCRGRSRSWCRRRRVRARGDIRQHEGRGDAEGRGESSRHARSQSTSTGVPWPANAYINGASRAIIRTQPCEAGYVGTGQYSCIAIPPVK